MSDQTPNLPAVQADTGNALASLSSRAVDLARINAQMAAMQANNTGGKGGGTFDMKGKTKVEVNKNGTLTFTNPFTGRPDGGRLITVVPIDVKFHLERWLAEGEVIEGVDAATQKGPLCRTVQYTDPVDTSKIDETGWFYQPPMSAYHARKMLPDLTGNGGEDGKRGMMLCADCPLSQQGLKGKDALCKPAGMMEMVVFKVGDEFLPEPVFAVVKMSQTSIIQYNEYIEKLRKVHTDAAGNPIMTPILQVITTLEAEKVSSGGKTYAKIAFHPAGRTTPKILDQANDAINKTEAIIAAAEGGDSGGGQAVSTTAPTPF